MISFSKKILTFAFLLMTLFLFGCSNQSAKKIILAPPKYLLPDEYQRPVVQGKKIDIQRLNLVKVGSSKTNVQLLLGEPVIQDIFNPTKWIYFYKEQTDEKGLMQYRVEINFKDDKVEKIIREGI